MPSVLIVDDQKELHDILRVVVQPLGCDAQFAFNGEEALKLFKNDNFDVVLSDIAMAPMDGIALLKEIKAVDSQAVVILMTGYGSMDTAVSALKIGAFDYIQKPLKIKEFVSALKKGLDAKNTGQVSRPITATAQRTIAPFQVSENCHALIGNHAGIVKARQQVDRLVNVSTPVLLQGPPGSGKKQIATSVHHSGKYSEGRMMGIDCAIADQDSLKLALLGEDGLGGDIIKNSINGTLYLQSVDGMDLKLQVAFAKLLKAVGHEFRVICCSTADLEAKMDEGLFSHELFYRIALSVIQLPGLSNRKSDIPAIVRSIVDSAENFKFDTRKIELSDAALKGLSGNIGNITLEQLIQKITNAVTKTEERIISPGLIGV